MLTQLTSAPMACGRSASRSVDHLVGSTYARRVYRWEADLCARWRPAGGSGAGVLTDLGAELGEFVAVGVAWHSARSVRARRSVRRSSRSRAASARKSASNFSAQARAWTVLGSGGGGWLRAGGVLLSQPRGLFGLLRPRNGLAARGLGGADGLASLRAGLSDGAVAFGFCGGDPRAASWRAASTAASRFASAAPMASAWPTPA
jgi:hypothetical protein